MRMNKMYVTHIIICFIYLKIFELGILVSGMSTVWEDIHGCAKQYRYVLAIKLMTQSSPLYSIIICQAIS